MNENKRNISTICALIKAYITNKQYHDGLVLYEDILFNQKRVKINDSIHILAIKACEILKDLERGKKIHINLKLNNKKVNLKTALIDFYFKCDDIDNARLIFNAMNKKSTRSTNAMIKGYLHIGQNEKALQLYQKMESKDKDQVSHLFAIKACINSGDFVKGKHIHENINCLDGIAINNALIEFYGHFDDISTAKQIFESLPNIDKVYCVGPMMAMYINHDKEEQALEMYDKFKCDSENVPHVLAIKACTKKLYHDKGKNIHKNISKNNYCLELQNALINFYGDCQDIEQAINVFNCIPCSNKDIVSISCMMKAFINNGMQQNALTLYDSMDNKYKNIYKDDIIHTLAIKACADIGDLEKGKEIHSVLLSNLSDDKLQLKNGLIKLYGNCLDITNAEFIFNSISERNRDIITINSMIQSYIDNDQSAEALQLYHNTNIRKDDVCHMLAINACINLEEYEKGMEIVSNITLSPLSNIKLKTTLIDFYGHCGKIDKSIEIFDCIPNDKKNIVIVTAMMEAYLNCDEYTKSIQLFEKMQDLNSNLAPESGCYVSALKACTNGTILHIGQKIHEMIKNTEMINDIGIQINLIKMYGKCGELNKCKEIFNDAISNDITAQSIGIWNAMIHAFGRNGETKQALKLYDKLIKDDLSKPDIKTFMHLMGSCSHSGDVESAKNIWNNIENNDYKYHTKVMSILIDCLSRKGELKEAEQLILSNDSSEISAWMSLMSGCNKYKDKTMANDIYNKMNDKFGNDKTAMSPASVLISNIYGYYDEYDKCEEIWQERISKGWNKPQGISEIYINGILHRFTAGTRYISNTEYDDIDDKLTELLEKLKNEYGYVMDENLVTRQLKSNETKESVLLRHSEKIALSFGLLKASKDEQIVINKNLRICPDCHTFIRLVSDLEKRKFIVSDINRVHVFECGTCSCKEYY